MIDHEKFQRARMWAYVAAIALVAVLGLWKVAAR